MAYTTINKSTEHFNTVTTTGGAKSITGVGFQPDWIWSKRRDSTSDHHVNDAVRGASKLIYTNATTAEQTNANFLTSFDSDGFTTGSAYWSSSANIVAWNWKANGAGSANTDGTINSTVSANTTSGFSIVSWTGTGANGTIGHGLNSTPQVVIVKDRSAGFGWLFGHNSLGSWTKNLKLNETIAVETITSTFNSTAPTSSVFSIGSSGANNGSGNSLIAYCFAEKTGYSKFGSYTGNGNADGNFIYTGFKPAFLIVKRYDAGGYFWHMYDNKRSSSGGSNIIDDVLYPQNNHAEYSGDKLDFVSNGIKYRSANGDINGSGGSYIYMAFAEAPLVGTNNVPCTAR